MTELLERAMDRAMALPPELQDEIARMVLSIAGDYAGRIPLTPEEDAAIARSIEAAARGEFASDEQVHALWAKHGL